MKKVALIFLFLVFIAGCSKDDTEISNELSIINNALAAVSVNFRGNSYRVTAGESTTIHNIPNSSYAYETAVEFPAGATSVSKGTHLEDTLEFTGKTKFTLYFTSTLSSGEYEITATLSTSDPEETTTETTTETATYLLNLF